MPSLSPDGHTITLSKPNFSIKTLIIKLPVVIVLDRCGSISFKDNNSCIDRPLKKLFERSTNFFVRIIWLYEKDDEFLNIPNMNLQSVLIVPPIPTSLLLIERSRSNCSNVGIFL